MYKIAILTLLKEVHWLIHLHQEALDISFREKLYYHMFQ